MAIVRTDIANLLEAQVRTGFMRGSEFYTPRRGPFCGTTNSDKAFEVYSDMGAVPWPGDGNSLTGSTGQDGRTGAERVNELGELGNIPVFEGNENPLMVYNEDWPLGIGIHHNAINDANVNVDLENWAMGVASRFEQHKDMLAFHMLNVGETDAAGKNSDGQPQFSDAHVTPKALYQVPQDNNYSLTLDLPSFNTVHTAGGDFKDEFGQPSGRSHDLIVAAHNLFLEAAQITGSIVPNQSGDVNPYVGQVRTIHSPGGYLDNGKWFLVDENTPQKPVYIQERQAPTLEIVDNHFTSVRYFIWKARYVPFYGDWRLVIKGN